MNGAMSQKWEDPPRSVVKTMAENKADFVEFLRLRQKGLFILSILILGFLGFRFWMIAQEPNLTGKMRATPGLVVELAGTVSRPEILSYSRSPNIQQVLRDSGGFATDQALSASRGKAVLNQDATLVISAGKDGTVDIQQKPLSVRALWILGRPLPINRLTAEDLDRIPGIGPSLALHIVNYRQRIGTFSSLDQLMEVNGIKEKTFESIRKYLTL